MTANTIARLKITLDNVEPVVLRRVKVRLTYDATACTWWFRPRSSQSTGISEMAEQAAGDSLTDSERLVLAFDEAIAARDGDMRSTIRELILETSFGI